VQPQTEDPGREGERVQAEVDETSTEHFRADRDPPHALHVRDVLDPHLGLDLAPDGVDGLGERPETGLFRGADLRPRAKILGEARSPRGDGIHPLWAECCTSHAPARTGRSLRRQHLPATRPAHPLPRTCAGRAIPRAVAHVTTTWSPWHRRRSRRSGKGGRRSFHSLRSSHGPWEWRCFWRRPPRAIAEEGRRTGPSSANIGR
jgi:hypothetical protein